MDYFKVLFSLTYILEFVNAVHHVTSESWVNLNPTRASLDLSTASLTTTEWPSRWSSLWSRRYGGTIPHLRIRYLPPMYLRSRRRQLRRQKLRRLVKARLLRQNALRKAIKNAQGVSPVTLATDVTNKGFRNLKLMPPNTHDVTDIILIETPVNDRVSEHTLNNNALMVLLNSRERSDRSVEDEKVIGRHLVALGSIRSNSNTAASTAIQRQLRYIEKIPNTAIRRETLKLYVKDMVDKSGFLSKSTDHKVIELSELMALVDRLSEITERFNQNSVDTGVSITEGKSLSRISNALAAYTDTPKQIEVPSGTPFLNDLNSFKSRWNSANGRPSLDRVAKTPLAVAERDSIRMPVVGKTIYGETPKLLVRLSTSTTTTPKSVTTARVRKSEPLGGTGVYWTHLRSSLVDLLCRLCQERDEQPCILRYCNNDSALP